MSVAVVDPEIPAASPAAVKAALRHLPGGVSIITAGIGNERTGLTVTTAASLSLDPPTMLVSVNRSASAYPVIRARRHFAVNVPGAHHGAVAERFAGAGGVRGSARYEGAEWFIVPSGASGLTDALVVIDCVVAEIIERHTHAIILGAVRTVVTPDRPAIDPLVHARGRFAAFPRS